MGAGFVGIIFRRSDIVAFTPPLQASFVIILVFIEVIAALFRVLDDHGLKIFLGHGVVSSILNMLRRFGKDTTQVP